MMNTAEIVIPPETVGGWQKIVNVIAEIFKVPAALVMKVEPSEITVFVSSESEGNPYERGEKARLNTGLYCETVMETRQRLLVPDALADKKWNANPDIELGMISYLGFPIAWPGGEIFGTICVLDRKNNSFSDLHERLLVQFRDAIESDLKTLSDLDVRLNEETRARLAEAERSRRALLSIIEDRQQAEEALRESERRYREMLQNVQLVALMLDERGRLTFCNDFLLELTGWQREEITGADWFETFLPPDVRKQIKPFFFNALQQGDIQEHVENEIVTRSGERRLIRWSNTVMRDPQGRAIGATSIGEDITERKRAREALESAMAELAHVTRVATLGEMTTSIAHEINQPLGAIANSASACLRWLEAQKPEEARRSAARVIAESHRASEIIGRIRALVKKAPPRKDWLDVNETIHEVIALADSEVQRNGVALEIQLSDDLPLILADRIQLQQVILNLMMNAMEAMNGPGEGPRELVVSSMRNEPQGVIVSVRDSGPGLDPQGLDHLFDAFYTTKPHGLGMGLAISRSLIEAHGGRLWASVNQPHGAVFQFTLPTGGDSPS
jgi:PAS domain S-box-containing protein